MAWTPTESPLADLGERAAAALEACNAQSWVDATTDQRADALALVMGEWPLIRVAVYTLHQLNASGIRRVKQTEMAALLGVSPQAVNEHLKKALAQLEDLRG